MPPSTDSHPPEPAGTPEVWPLLPLHEWRETYATLHMMTQVVGKIRLACAPMVNHSWQVLRQADRVLTEFRSGFVGKCSPVHFFWGSFDMAVTRFSGRRAPEHPGGIPNLADRVAREAYSRECSSCGFWPGSGAVQEPAFYAYTYPEPAGYPKYPVHPEEAYYSEEMREHILPYEAVRRARDPEGMLHDFFQSTYVAGAELGGWDRAELEYDGPDAGRTAPQPAPAFPRHDEER